MMSAAEREAAAAFPPLETIPMIPLGRRGHCSTASRNRDYAAAVLALPIAEEGAEAPALLLEAVGRVSVHRFDAAGLPQGAPRGGVEEVVDRTHRGATPRAVGDATRLEEPAARAFASALMHAPGQDERPDRALP